MMIYTAGLGLLTALPPGQGLEKEMGSQTALMVLLRRQGRAKESPGCHTRYAPQT